jgi:Domain of unknown function (DUF1990)
MASVQAEAEKEVREIVCAVHGCGPLLERDYFAAIEGASCTPEQVGAMIRDRFEEFAPPETAVFRRAGADKVPLEVDDELEIRIALLGHCRVRIVHADARSLTMRTLKGHPEAGRITFGASRDAEGRLTFRILSRTRASGLTNYLGFLLMGKQMQARCWIRFIDRVAEDCGGRIVGRIRVRTRKDAEDPADRGERDTPTFVCETEGAG